MTMIAERKINAKYTKLSVNCKQVIFHQNYYSNTVQPPLSGHPLGIEY